MVLRSIASVVLMLASLIAAPVAAAAPARIVAVGDLHGDYGAWIDIARGAGLIDARDRWRGGGTTLVQMGDIVDRGPDSLKIIRHLMRLQREARRAGGQVIVLVGNHEAMMMTGDLRYTHPGEFAAFATRNSDKLRNAWFDVNRAGIEADYRKTNPALSASDIRRAWLAATPLGWAELRAAWRPVGELGRWTLANPAVVKIGSSLFVHGGISASYTALSVNQLNQRVTAALAEQSQSPTAIINDELGPLWYRGLVARGEPDGKQEIDGVLSAFGVHRIVVGHTPRLAGVAVERDGRLVRVDTGASSAYGGQLGYAEIVGDEVTPRSVPRSAGSR